MNKKGKLTCFLLILTFLLLVTSAVHAENADTNITSTEKVTNNDNTNNHIKETYKTNTEVKTPKEQVQNKTITKTDKQETKQAGKTAVYYNIKIYNNIVQNATIEVGVIDYKTSKAIPNSSLKLQLPTGNTITAKTPSSGYSNITMNLPNGKNTVKITYDGTDKYTPYDYDLVMNITKRNTNMHVNVDGSNTTGNVNLTTSLNDVITSTPIKNAKITVTISDGQKITANTGNNAVALTPIKLSTGRHFINITYDGDSTYNSSKATLNLTIGTPKNIMTYDVVLNSLYVGNTSITIKTIDFDTKKPLPNTNIKVKFSNGKQYSLKTDKNAQVTFKPDVPVGRNDMNIIFDANSTYYGRDEKVNFTVNKRVSNLTVVVGGDTSSLTLNASLKDLVFNKPIQQAQVTINLPNNTKVTQKTNNNGFFSYPMKLNEGNHTIKVTYPGNANLTNITRTVTVNVPKARIPVTYNVTVQNNRYLDDVIQITVIDTNTTKAMPNSKLTIKLPDKTIQLTANNKGQVSFKSNMTPGTHNITISYPGNTKYENRTATVPIIITKRPSVMATTATYGNGITLSLNLTDALTNKTIPNAKIIVKHPKKNITLTTDKNGKINSRLDLPEGKAKIQIIFQGNTYYLPCNTTSTELNFPKIIKTDTIITVNPVKGIVGDKITLTAHITDTKQKPVTGGNIVFKINGKTLRQDGKFNSNAPALKLSVKNGIVTTTILADKYIRDAKNISASYSGNINYYENNTKTSTVAQIQLRKAQLTVTATPSPQKHYEVIQLKATVKDLTSASKIKPANDETSYVFFKVNGRTLVDANGKQIKAKLVNGTATYNYKVPAGMAGIGTDKKARYYSVTAGLYHPNYYPNTKNTTTFSVSRSSVTISLNRAEFNTKTKILTISANIQDYKKYNVIGNTKVNIKVNGKSISINNKPVITAADGKIALQTKIDNSIKTVKSVTIVCGERCAYFEGRTTITNVKQV